MFSSKKMHLKLSLGKWWPFSPGINVLTSSCPLHTPLLMRYSYDICSVDVLFIRCFHRYMSVSYPSSWYKNGRLPRPPHPIPNPPPHPHLTPPPPPHPHLIPPPPPPTHNQSENHARTHCREKGYYFNGMHFACIYLHLFVSGTTNIYGRICTTGVLDR